MAGRASRWRCASPLRAWWDSQGPEPVGLTSLVRSALDQNRDLRAAREGYVTAQEQVSEAWSNVYPSVTLDASYTRNISPAVSFIPAQAFDPTASPDEYISLQFGADNQYSSTIGIEQPLFRPGVIVALGAAGRFESLQQEAVRGQSQSVVTQVRLGYYQLLLAQEQERLTARSVERVRESAQGDPGAQSRRAGLGVRRAPPRGRARQPRAEPAPRRECGPSGASPAGDPGRHRRSRVASGGGLAGPHRPDRPRRQHPGEP